MYDYDRLVKLIKNLSGWVLAIGAVVSLIVGGIIAISSKSLILFGAFVAFLLLLGTWWLARILYENAMLLEDIVKLERSRDRGEVGMEDDESDMENQ